MRPLLIVLIVSAVLVVPAPARADEPDTALALFTGAAVDTVGFLVGGTLLGTAPPGGNGDGQRSFGWLAIQAGFTLAPLASHGVVDEWGRGALFAAVPAATLAGTAALFRWQTDGIAYGTWEQQWLLWGTFTAGLAVSTIGVVDVVFASKRQRERGLAVRPTIGYGQAGLSIEGSL
jgi:hypothetical protein